MEERSKRGPDGPGLSQRQFLKKITKGKKNFFAFAKILPDVDNQQWSFTEDCSVVTNGLCGGLVTLLKEPRDGALLTIVGATPYIRTETYVPSVPDVPTMNVEGNKTIYRLQQLHRDILGCLKNRREETENENTELPVTEKRVGHLATWGTETGRLTYAGDPDEGGDDPTADFLRRSQNLADLNDAATARQNLGVVQGHIINGLPSRSRLTFSGTGVSVADVSSGDATVVTFIQTVHSFADLAGVAKINQGGTGAANAADAKKNLQLHMVATTGQFWELASIPPLISHVLSEGVGVPLVEGTINRVVSVRSLVGDQSITVEALTGKGTVQISVGAIPVGKITGVLPAENGGTRMPQRGVLRFEGDLLAISDRNNETVVQLGEFPRGSIYGYSVRVEDFIGGKLTIDAAELPFPVTGNLLIQTRDSHGFYTNCGIRIFLDDSIEITGFAFDGDVLICSGGEGNFATVSFSANDFIGTTCHIPESSIGFDPARAIVQCVFAQGSYFEHVQVQISTAAGMVVIGAAIGFNGILLVRGSGLNPDNYSEYHFLASAFPFSPVRPSGGTQRDDGQWVECSLRIPDRGDVYLRGEPFDGTFTAIQGIRALIPRRLEILDSQGNALPRESKLQFTGSVSVTDDAAEGKIIVAVSGGAPLPVENAGDLLVGAGPGVLEALPVGTEKQALLVDKGMPAWKSLGGAAASRKAYYH
ncbi:MAG: hypothetical protein LBI34_03235 [Puniceicoccales bacterium]|nr:hypothetical protein [Puniceicoccales bacterium]